MTLWRRFRVKLGPALRRVGGWVLMFLAGNRGVSALFLPVPVDLLDDTRQR